MAWLVRFGKNYAAEPLYMYFTELDEAGVTENPLRAFRFETKGEAEQAAFEVVVKWPSLIGSVWVECRPAISVE